MICGESKVWFACNVQKEIFKMRYFLSFCSFVLCFLFIGFLDAMIQKDVGRFVSFLNFVISLFVAIWVYSDKDKSDWRD